MGGLPSLHTEHRRYLLTTSRRVSSVVFLGNVLQDLLQEVQRCHLDEKPDLQIHIAHFQCGWTKEDWVLVSSKCYNAYILFAEEPPVTCLGSPKASRVIFYNLTIASLTRTDSAICKCTAWPALFYSLTLGRALQWNSQETELWPKSNLQTLKDSKAK